MKLWEAKQHKNGLAQEIRDLKKVNRTAGQTSDIKTLSTTCTQLYRIRNEYRCWHVATCLFKGVPMDKIEETPNIYKPLNVRRVEEIKAMLEPTKPKVAV